MLENGDFNKKIDEIGFAKVATLNDIEKNGYVLTPGRYVGIKLDEDETPFEEKMKGYSEETSSLLKEEEKLVKNVKDVFKALNFKV